MGGEGSISFMISSYKNNRNLLKGQPGGTYQNFDKSYITKSIISQKPLKFKETDPKYLEQLNEQLALEKAELKRKKLFVLGFSITFTAALAFYLFAL